MFSIRDRQILKIAIPSIVSNITVPLLGLIDVAITGHLGSSAYLGAIAVGGMLFNIIYWMFAFLRMGTSGMTAQAYGKRDILEIRRLLVTSLFIAGGISLLLIILSSVIRDVSLWFISPTPEVKSLACTYFNICIFGAPASLGLFVLNGWFIGMQNSKTPMFIAITQNVLNIFASLVFVYLLHMKIEGVAFGTVLAQWGGFIIALVMLRKYYGKILYNRTSGFMHNEVFSKQNFLGFFSVNKDIFFRTLCLISIHFFFISAGAKLGNVELALNTLLMQLFTLYSYFMDGFAFAGEALAGKAIGARERTVYDDVVKRLFVWGGAMVLIFTTCYAVGGRWFLSLLTDEQNVLQAALGYQPWTLLFPICGLAAFIWDGIYIGATATRQMLLSTFFGMLVFFLIYILLFDNLQNHCLWMAFNANLFMRGIVLTLARKKIAF